MKKSNNDFIHERCHICGQKDLVLSEITLKANYGSKHDGEVLHIHVCGECIDSILEDISHGEVSKEFKADSSLATERVLARNLNSKGVKYCEYTTD